MGVALDRDIAIASSETPALAYQATHYFYFNILILYLYYDCGIIIPLQKLSVSLKLSQSVSQLETLRTTEV